MLRIVQNSSAQGAKSYYSTSDYYTEGQELVGEWRGKGAERLKLSGTIDRSEWDALCDNRDPNTGKSLTVRQKEPRRVGYDFNFHVPKSVSLVYGLTGDERILDAFRSAVDATMAEMEAEMQTRVRVSGTNDDRTTGNMLWGEFVHFTARPVEGVADPHLHAHCFVFNTTWDPEESRWKAGQFAALKRDAPYFEASFHARLAHGLAELGFGVERTKRGWELAGVPTSALRKFSRRTELIEEKAREQGITDPRLKGELGAKTRARKSKRLTMTQLREEWGSRLTDGEQDAVARVAGHRDGPTKIERPADASRAVDLALDHCLERSSVVAERRVLAEAMKRAYGTATPEAIRDAFGKRELLAAQREGERWVTTTDVLSEEKRMVAFARDGRGTCRPLATSGRAIQREWLNAGQRKAVEDVLASRDRVMLIRGAAGVGKTASMQETVEAIEAGGHRVFTFAPSADASRGVLRGEGFENADTVARLLLDERLQREVRGQVIWADEAGLLGSRTMSRLFDLAGKLDARVVLSGDRRQHGSVERGAALRLLEEEAGVVPAEIREIQRQKGEYKSAVQALADGKTKQGLEQLDRLGWVKEVAGQERYHMLAVDYATAWKEGKSALVVSPTHLEGEWITHEIRSELRKRGLVGKKEHRIEVLASANLTEAERADPVNYGPGDVIVYHQNAKGVTKGARKEVDASTVPVRDASRFQVYHRRDLTLAAGDLVRITRNGKSADGKHALNNGAVYAIKRFARNGDLVLANGWKVSKDFGHLAHGYVVTSHASQGKTVDRVLIGQSSESMRAASREQFYVSVSRGKERATVYTDDKTALLEAVGRTDDRISASELLADNERRVRAATMERLRQQSIERPRELSRDQFARARVR